MSTPHRASESATTLPDQRTDYRRRLAYHAQILNTIESGAIPRSKWTALATTNISRTRAVVTSLPAHRALDRWQHLVDTIDLDAIADLCRARTDDADFMRSLSPFAGMLTDDQRASVLIHEARHA